MLLISLSHEKQTATKPRASRDREFLSYEQVCAIGVASPTPANPHHAAARRACRATDTLATREAEPTNTKSSFQACQSGPARNLSTLSRRRVGLRTRRSASWPWPGPRRWYCCRQRHWLTGNLNRSGPRGVIAPLEVRHTDLSRRRSRTRARPRGHGGLLKLLRQLGGVGRLAGISLRLAECHR